MHDMPPRVSEEQLPWVQVTPYHLHNTVNLPGNLLHSTYTCCLEVMAYVICLLYYTTVVITVPRA